MFENITYQTIKQKDESQLKSLIERSLSLLECPDFFIPYSKWELDNFFDVDYAYLHGAYDGDILVGMAQIYVQKDILEEEMKLLGITEEKTCEFGGNLLLPEYQGKGIMTALIKMQIDFIKQLDYKYVIAKTHPDNIAGNKLFTKIKMEKRGIFTLNNGFIRNIYLMKL